MHFKIQMYIQSFFNLTKKKKHYMLQTVFPPVSPSPDEQMGNLFWSGHTCPSQWKISNYVDQ